MDDEMGSCEISASREGEIVLRFEGCDHAQSMSFDEAARLAGSLMAVVTMACPDADADLDRLVEVFKARWVAESKALASAAVEKPS